MLEITHACLIVAHMQFIFLGDVIVHVIYLMKLVPSSALKFKTSLKKLSTYVNIPSNLTLVMRVFKSVAFVHLHKY
jgi:hypothetical protein